jgi:hypothetical protein
MTQNSKNFLSLEIIHGASANKAALHSKHRSSTESTKRKPNAPLQEIRTCP